MLMKIFVLIMCLTVGSGFPSPRIENYEGQKQNNHSDTESSLAVQHHLDLVEWKNVSSQHKSPGTKDIIEVMERIDDRSRTFGPVISFAIGGLLAALDLVEEFVFEGEDISATTETVTPQVPTATSDLPEPTTEPPSSVTFESEYQFTTQSFESINAEILKEIHVITNSSSPNVRQIRQEDDGENDVNGNKSNSGEQQEAEDGDEDEGNDDDDDDDDDGGGQGLLAAIISGFLGSLSKPDGSVDVDAVIAVIGSLSTLNDDGTYDFTGLQDTLGAFFGGGEDGGGSDVGMFTGGVLAAAIRGLATPPGAKGAGKFVGNVLREVLPAISGPGTTEEGVTTTLKPQINAGGFLWGLLNSLFGGGTVQTHTPKPPSMFHTIKTNLLKFVFSALSSILATSSTSGKNE